jgi:hypothetical protein
MIPAAKIRTWGQTGQHSRVHPPGSVVPLHRCCPPVQHIVKIKISATLKSSVADPGSGDFFDPSIRDR